MPRHIILKGYILTGGVIRVTGDSPSPKVIVESIIFVVFDLDALVAPLRAFLGGIVVVVLRERLIRDYVIGITSRN